MAPIPEPPGAFDGRLFGASCTSASNCLAVGSGESTGSAIGSLVEHWNGKAWADQPSPNPTTEGDVEPLLEGVTCVSAGDCWAVGYDYTISNTSNSLVEQWNGKTWSVVGSPDVVGAIGSDLSGVTCTSSSYCLAVGTTVMASSPYELPLAEEWNGKTWSISTPLGVSGAIETLLTAVACPAVRTCLATGYSLSSSGTIPLVEEWNGSTWTMMTPAATAGTDGTRLDGIACPSTTRCIAVGRTYPDNGNQSVPLAEIWSGGATWSLMTIPAPTGTYGSFLVSVSCGSATTCEAAGEGYQADTGTQTLVEELSGTTWSDKASPNESGVATSFLSALACPPSSSDCVAAGQYYTPDEDHLLAMVSGAHGWAITNAPGPIDPAASSLSAVACSSATCLAVGQWFPANAFNTSALMELWTGTEWRMGGGAEPPGADVTSLLGAACTGTDDCLAVGDVGIGSAGDDGDAGTFAEDWIGKTWSVMATPNPTGAVFSRLSAIACTTSTSCVAVGDSQTTPGGPETALAETLSKKWSLVTVPAPAGAEASSLAGVACHSATSCVAVGSYVSSVGATEPLSETWNGRTWTVLVVPPSRGTSGNELLGVGCLSSTTCMAVGTAVAADGDDVTLAERLVGTSWSPLTTPDVPDTATDVLTGIACPSTTSCTASAYAIDSKGDTAFLEQWNGKAWSTATSGALAGDFSTGLNGIACESGIFCTAAGSRPDGSGNDDALIEAT